MRYYSTQRPIGLGTYPQSPWNKVVEIHNFDSKIQCEEFGQEAWGYIDYEQPIHPEDAVNFELFPAPNKVKLIKYIGTDSWGREVYKDKDGMLWKYTEAGPMPRERHECLHSLTSNTLDGEPGWPMNSDIDYKIEEERHDEE